MAPTDNHILQRLRSRRKNKIKLEKEKRSKNFVKKIEIWKITSTRAVDAGPPEPLLLDDEARAYKGTGNHSQYKPFQITRVHLHIRLNLEMNRSTTRIVTMRLIYRMVLIWWIGDFWGIMIRRTLDDDCCTIVCVLSLSLNELF